MRRRHGAVVDGVGVAGSAGVVGVTPGVAVERGAGVALGAAGVLLAVGVGVEPWVVSGVTVSTITPLAQTMRASPTNPRRTPSRNTVKAALRVERVISIARS